MWSVWGMGSSFFHHLQLKQGNVAGLQPVNVEQGDVWLGSEVKAWAHPSPTLQPHGGSYHV
jgi:hypothetical protein